MRVNLTTKPSGRAMTGKTGMLLSLTIRPACGFPGEFQLPMDSHALMRLLRQETDLSAPALERFEDKLCAPIGARLLGVELSEGVLTDMGYFID